MKQDDTTDVDQGIKCPLTKNIHINTHLLQLVRYHAFSEECRNINNFIIGIIPNIGGVYLISSCIEKLLLTAISFYIICYTIPAGNDEFTGFYLFYAICTGI